MESPRSKQARIALDKQRVERLGLSYFIRSAFPVVEPGTEYLHNWHIDAISERLTDVSRGQTRELAIHVPPGCMKSLAVSVCWPVWEWIDNPNNRFFSISYLPDLALDHTRRSRDLIKSDWYQDRWGDRFQLPTICAMGEYENDKFGWRYSASIGGGITGWHCDTMIVDDPVNPKELSKAALEQVDTWWHRVRPTRYRDLATSRTVLVMQRLHDQDPGAIAAAEGFDVLCLPMRYRPKAAWARDPRKVEGELLWPAKFPQDEVAKMCRNLGAQNAAAQYDQSPVPDGGLVFKSEWFRQWVRPGCEPPAVEQWTTLPKRFDKLVQSWDCAFKDEASSDWVVGQVWGVKGADFFLLDQYREQTNVLGTAAGVAALYAKWSRSTGVLIEEKANGAAVMQILKKRVRGMVPIDPEGGKIARAQAVATFFEAGNVYHPPPGEADWLLQHRGELTIFPMGAHDDTVDACSQALTWLHTNRSGISGLSGKTPDDLRDFFDV